MSIWLKQGLSDRKGLIQRTEENENVKAIAVEKDWWLTALDAGDPRVK